MSRPIFDQPSLERIHAARAAGAGDLAEARDDDWHLCLKRDRNDLRLPKGTGIVARMGEYPKDGELAVVRIGREYVIRRAPVADGPGDGKVVGVVVGVVVEVPDA